MRVIAFIQDALVISDIIKTQRNADFRAPPPIPTLIDTSQAIDKLPVYDSFEPSPEDLETPLPR
jgi:hypothetical protein